jgi:hypothetical protein
LKTVLYEIIMTSNILRCMLPESQYLYLLYIWDLNLLWLSMCLV